jgi:hypothetical protein
MAGQADLQQLSAVGKKAMSAPKRRAISGTSARRLRGGRPREWLRGQSVRRMRKRLDELAQQEAVGGEIDGYADDSACELLDDLIRYQQIHEGPSDVGLIRAWMKWDRGPVGTPVLATPQRPNPVAGVGQPFEDEPGAVLDLIDAIRAGQFEPPWHSAFTPAEAVELSQRLVKKVSKAHPWHELPGLGAMVDWLLFLQPFWLRPLDDWLQHGEGGMGALCAFLFAHYPLPGVFLDYLDGLIHDGSAHQLEKALYLTLAMGRGWRLRDWLRELQLPIWRGLEQDLARAPKGIGGAQLGLYDWLIYLRCRVKGGRSAIGIAAAELVRHLPRPRAGGGVELDWRPMDWLLRHQAALPDSLLEDLVTYCHHLDLEFGDQQRERIRNPWLQRQPARVIRDMRQYLAEVEGGALATGVNGDEVWTARGWDWNLEQGPFTIRELTSVPELVEEGRAMTHCVASYARKCLDGQCAIFTLRDRADKRVATLELHPTTLRVVQCLSLRNSKPSAAVLAFARSWHQEVVAGRNPG